MLRLFHGDLQVRRGGNRCTSARGDIDVSCSQQRAAFASIELAGVKTAAAGSIPAESLLPSWFCILPCERPRQPRGGMRRPRQREVLTWCFSQQPGPGAAGQEHVVNRQQVNHKPQSKLLREKCCKIELCKSATSVLLGVVLNKRFAEVSATKGCDGRATHVAIGTGGVRYRG